MTIPARYTLTEAHFKIVELEARIAEAERERDELENHRADTEDFLARIFDRVVGLVACVVELERERDELREKLLWTQKWGVAAEARCEALTDLVVRFRQWDMLDVAADGPFWKRTIDAALDNGGTRHVEPV